MQIIAVKVLWTLVASPNYEVTYITAKSLGLIQPKLGCFSYSLVSFHGLLAMIHFLTSVTQEYFPNQ